MAGQLGIKTISLLPLQFRLLFGMGHSLTGEALVAAGRRYQNRIKFVETGEDFEIKLRIDGDYLQDPAAMLDALEAFLLSLQDRECQKDDINRLTASKIK